MKYAFYDGSEWAFESVDNLGDLEIAHFGARRTTTVALDGRDRAYVAYSDRSVLRFARKMETGWAISQVSGSIREGHELAQFVTMELEPNGRPHFLL